VHVRQTEVAAFIQTSIQDRSSDKEIITKEVDGTLWHLEGLVGCWLRLLEALCYFLLHTRPQSAKQKTRLYGHLRRTWLHSPHAPMLATKDCLVHMLCSPYSPPAVGPFCRDDREPV
jgi:hypothetical protein